MTSYDSDIEALLGKTPSPPIPSKSSYAKSSSAKAPPENPLSLTRKATADLNEARARAARATAAKSELQTAKLAGELLEVAAVAARWQTIAHDIRAGLLAIPDWLTGQGVDARTARLVEAEIRATLERLADDR